MIQISQDLCYVINYTLLNYFVKEVNVELIYELVSIYNF